MKGLIEVYIIGASEIICKLEIYKYYWIFSKKLCFEKRENIIIIIIIIIIFGKEIKWKVVIRMHYNKAEIYIPPKITLQL